MRLMEARPGDSSFGDVSARLRGSRFQMHHADRVPGRLWAHGIDEYDDTDLILAANRSPLAQTVSALAGRQPAFDRHTADISLTLLIRLK
jgi:hypothetical protein